MTRAIRAVVIAVAGVALALVAGVAGRAAPRAADETPLTITLNRVGGKVREYYQHAQSIVSTETVQMQTLGADLAPVGPVRRLVYELRTEWNVPDSPGALPEADVVRRLLTVNGRQPSPSDEAACADPRAVSPEPLFMLLPEHRREFGFSLGRPQKLGARMATIVEYISLPVGSNEATWKKDCVSIPLEGKTVGRIWIDTDSDDVLRLEEHLVGMVDVRVPKDYARSGPTWMSLERSDYTIRYQPVSFRDPDEILMLPASIESLRIFRGIGVSRMRITQTYSGYRRFLTNSRMLPPV